jgi:hypothetical protein
MTPHDRKAEAAMRCASMLIVGRAFLELEAMNLALNFAKPCS